MANPYMPPTASPQGGGWGPAGAAGAATPDGYEFGGHENEIIDKAGRRARLWGIFSYIIGALHFVGVLIMFAAASLLSALAAKMGGGSAVFSGIMGGAIVMLIVQGIVYIVMGRLYTDAGEQLRSVVVTAGNDVQHLMHSLRKLGTSFQIEAIMTIAGFVIGFAAGFIGALA